MGGARAEPRRDRNRGRARGSGARAHLAVVQPEWLQVGRRGAGTHCCALDALHGGARGRLGRRRKRRSMPSAPGERQVRGLQREACVRKSLEAEEESLRAPGRGRRAWEDWAEGLPSAGSCSRGLATHRAARTQAERLGLVLASPDLLSAAG